MILSDEDIAYIKWAKEIIDRAHYPDTKKITEVYNRCYSDRPNFKPVSHTNCGSCLRQRVLTLHRDMENILKKMEIEKVKKEQQNDKDHLKKDESKS